LPAVESGLAAAVQYQMMAAIQLTYARVTFDGLTDWGAGTSAR